jgi:hypothetical protein
MSDTLWECECGDSIRIDRAGGWEAQAKLTRWQERHEGCIQFDGLTNEEKEITEERRLDTEPVLWIGGGDE